MTPKGTILIIGGSEDKGEEEKETQQQNKEYEKFEILKELLPLNGKKRIEIITTASNEPEEMKKTYLNAFKKIGFTNVGFINIENKPEARETEFCKRIEKAHAVLFTGGDQFKLSAILGGTDTVDAIKDKLLHDKDFVIAGTSAGAMAMSNIMIYEGGVHEAILKDDLKTTSGLGICDSCIIDTHFIKRGRFGRLAHAVTMNPETLGVGLGEDTALIIKKGCEVECRGSGMVVIIDGNEIEQTNITSITDGDPIFVENLKVHLIVKGNRFSFTNRKMIDQITRKKRSETKVHA